MAHGLLFQIEYDNAAMILFGKTEGLTHAEHKQIMDYIGGDESFDDIFGPQ